MSNPHALIIDDNQGNIDVLVTLLMKEGVVCTAVPTLRQLKPTLDQLSHIDLVFLDLEFPNGDGFTVLEDLKRDARLNGAPVVAYTVHTSEIEVARRAGFDSFIGKPVRATEFPAQLRRLLNGQAVWEA